MPIEPFTTTHYRTSDGEVFTLIEDARRHEDDLDFDRIYNDDDHFVCGQIPALRAFLIRNAAGIIEWLNQPRLPAPPPPPPAPFPPAPEGSE